MNAILRWSVLSALVDSFGASCNEANSQSPHLYTSRDREGPLLGCGTVVTTGRCPVLREGGSEQHETDFGVGKLI